MILFKDASLLERAFPFQARYMRETGAFTGWLAILASLPPAASPPSDRQNFCFNPCSDQVCDLHGPVG
jgi:hypothetical protein